MRALNGYRRNLIWLLCISALASPAFVAVAENSDSPVDEPSNWYTHLGTSGRFNYFSSDNQLSDEEDFVGATLQGKFEAEFKDWLSLELDARGSRHNKDQHAHSQAGDSESHSAAELTEGFIALQSDDTSLRLGKQIVAWGRADFLNPTDNLTPHNYVVLLPNESDQRFGTVSALLTQHLNQDFTLAIFTTPFFEPSQIPLPRDLVGYEEDKPTHSADNTEVGLRLSRSGDRVDGSISYFHGFNLQPDFAPLSFSPLNRTTVELSYAEIDVFGMDLATTLGRYGLRMEAAYTRTDDRNGDDPFRRNAFWYYVFGADRVFDGTFSINVQLFGRHVSDYAVTDTMADPIAQLVTAYNALVAQQQDRDSYGVTARISDSWLNDTLSAEILLVRNFTRSNNYLRPQITYAVSDRMTAGIGAQLYTGSDKTYFGSLKDNRYFYTELRYSL